MKKSASFIVVMLALAMLTLLAGACNQPDKSLQALRPKISVASKEQYPSPVVLQYVDRDGQQRSTYSNPGRITIIAKKDTAPEIIRALVKSMSATVYVEIANCDLYFAKGFDGRESTSVSSLLQNPIVDDAFPTPVWSAKELNIIDDYSTIITLNGEYLHDNGDGTFSWQKESKGALSHGQLDALLSGVNGIDSASPVTDKDGNIVKDKDGNIVYQMAVEGALKVANDYAREDRERGEIAVLNNSWGAAFNVSKGASATDRRQATDTFLKDERKAYIDLVQFLRGNPNAIVVKAAGNEGLDISEIMEDANEEAGDKTWKRFVIVGALDSNLNPTAYSNRAIGRETDMLWVPELVTKDGRPVPGTSFVAPQISYLLNRIAQERRDLTPEQIVSVLFDQRVSPRVNLRPTIMNPRSDDTFKTAIKVAAELFPPVKNTEKSKPPSGASIYTGTPTATIDSVKYQLVSARSEVRGTSLEEEFVFDIVASGTASGPVGSWLSFGPWSPNQLQSSGWTLSPSSPVFRGPSDPAETSWTATYKEFTLSTSGAGRPGGWSHFDGKANTFEVKIAVISPESGGWEEKAWAKKQVTIPHP